MKNKLILLLFFPFIINCNNHNDIEYKWNIIGIERKIINNEQEVIFTLNYTIKNNTNENIWLYDMQKGNDWQYIEYEKHENIIKKYLYIYQPYEKSSDWIGSGGYNQNDPGSIIIHPNKRIKGEVKISFKLDMNMVATNLIYQFNFIILDIETGTDFNKSRWYESIERHVKNYFVEIRIPRRMWKEVVDTEKI